MLSSQDVRLRENKIENEAAPLSIGDKVSSEQTFDMRLGALCFELAQGRKDCLLDQAKALARQRSPIRSGRGLAKNFWDEYSLFLANDENYGRSIYDQELAFLCRKILDELSDFERKLLERTTEQYCEFWREDEEDSSSDDVRRWLIEEIFAKLSCEALNHGEDLLNSDEDE